MKLSSALISLIAATGAVEGFKIQTAEDKLRVKQDFMAAMHQKTAIKKAGKLGKAQKLKKLNEDLMTASRKLASNGGNSYYNGSQQQQQQADNYDQQQQQASSQGYSSFLADQEGNLYFQGDDGLYYDAYGAVVYPNDSGLYPWEYNAIPYDLSARALKYAGCAAIKTYDTEQAQYTGNPMVIDTMAVFRLCPASSCNQYSITGCGKNYGEYTVDVKTYLTYLLSYYDDEYNNYCEYCNACDYDVQATRKQSLSECHEQMNQDDWEYTQQLQQQAYQDFLNANGGEADNAGFHFYGQSPYNDGSGFDSYNGQYYNGANTQGGVNNPSSYYSQHDYSSNSSTNEYNQYYQEDNSTNRHLEDEDQDQNQNQNQNQNSGAYQNQYYRGLYGNGNGQQAYKQCQQFVSSMQAMYSTADRSDYYNSNQNYNNANAQSYYDENGNYNANGYQNNNGNANSINDASMADYWDTQDCCLDGSVCDACQIEAEQTYGDCDHYVCGDYYNYCESNYYQDDDDVDLLEFLECVAYTDENSGMEYYLGPHCGSDHYTISLGLFSDENCLDYVGDSVSLSSVLGFQYQDSDLFKFPEGCISCEGVEEYAEQKEGNNDGAYGEYSQAPDSDMDSILAMCTSLYEVSAQCNKNMNNFEQVSRLMTVNELADEDRTCTFIDNIMGGSYDESGEITLKGNTFEFSDWKNPRQYGRLKMPASQAIALSFSIILCMALAAVAIAQTRSIKRGGKVQDQNPWAGNNFFRRGKGSSASMAAADGLIKQRRPSVGESKPPRIAPKRGGPVNDATIETSPTDMSGIMATRSTVESGSSYVSMDPDAPDQVMV